MSCRGPLTCGMPLTRSCGTPLQRSNCVMPHFEATGAGMPRRWPVDSKILVDWCTVFLHLCAACPFSKRFRRQTQTYLLLMLCVLAFVRCHSVLIAVVDQKRLLCDLCFVCLYVCAACPCSMSFGILSNISVRRLLSLCADSLA